MVKRTKDPSAEEQLFQQAMQDVKPLNAQLRADTRGPGKPSRVRESRGSPPAETPARVIPGPPPAVSGDVGDASYRREGVQTRLLQKLKRGHFPPGDELDLHHMSVNEGFAALYEFITEAQERKLRCIRFIHGKGLRSRAGPVLRNMVHQALREHDAVLAFTTCKPADGGSGAVDVLLRTA